MASKLDDQIDLIRMRIAQGYNNTEIADELETTEASVRRARKKHHLGRSEYTQPSLDTHGEKLPYTKSKAMRCYVVYWFRVRIAPSSSASRAS